ncbi:MAG: type II secretion system F family protein [Candidatus Babeliaceae bacterium]
MPFFKWVGLSGDEILCKGKLFARSEEHARQKLQQQAVRLLLMHSYKPFLYKKVSLEEKLAFIAQLSELLTAGIRLSDALSIARASIKNSYFLLHIDDCMHAVTHGVPFHQACAFYDHIFDHLMISLLTVGHETGNLAGATKKIADYLTASQTFKERVRAALLMPLITSIFFVGIAGFIFMIIIPRFEALLYATKVPLPKLTRVILGISSWIRSPYGLLTVLGILIGIPLLTFIIRKTRLKYVIDALLLRVPFIGQLLYEKTMATTLLITGILLSERIPLVPALQEAQKTISNAVLYQAFDEVIQLVASGKALSMAFNTNKILHNAHIESLLQVGEATGMLDRLLLQAASLFQKRVEKTLAVGTTFIQPALLMILGLFIGLLVIAVYMPLMTLTSHIGTI